MNIQEVFFNKFWFFELSPRLWLFYGIIIEYLAIFFLLLDTFPFFIMPFARRCWSFWKILRGFMSKLFTFECCQPPRLLVCKTIVLLVYPSDTLMFIKCKWNYMTRNHCNFIKAKPWKGRAKGGRKESRKGQRVVLGQQFLGA